MSKEVQKSKLVPVGLGLVLVGCILPGLVKQLGSLLRENNEEMSPLVKVLYVGTDLLSLCFFIGAICLIIGLIRDRKYKKEFLLANKESSAQQDIEPSDSSE